MIEQYLEFIQSKALTPQPIRCFFLAGEFFMPVEQHLADTGLFFPAVPDSYPSHYHEKQGFRWLRNPVRGAYRDINRDQDDSIDTAVTTLHLKARQTDKSAEAIALMHNGTIPLRDEIVQAEMGDIASVFLTDDGIILAYHFPKNVQYGITNCWHKGNKKLPYSFPYPESASAAADELSNTVNVMPITDEERQAIKKNPSYSVMPIMIMLCVEAVRQRQCSS